MRRRLLLLVAVAALISAVPVAQAVEIYATDFSSDPVADGWTLSTWQWGVATASSGCSGSQDPATDHSAGSDNRIVGSEIGACYSNSMAVEYLVSPTMNCTGYVGVQLDFWRFLGVESATYDHAGVDLSTDGGSTWAVLWEHTGGSFSDTAWTPFTYNLTAASNQAAVNVRFRMGPTDSSVTYCGFSVDDFSVYTLDEFCVAVDPAESTTGAGQGDLAVHALTVVNCGTSADQISLSVSGNTWPTVITDTSGNPISSVNVPAQSTAQIQVRVTVGAEASDTATLTASNTTDATTFQATITTAQILYFEDFETDPAAAGWTGFVSGQWEWGSATASSGCSGGQDPAEDHTGTADNNLIGYDIGGCYTNSMSALYVTSPPFDFSDLVNVHMSFWRFLGVESASYDHAAIEGSSDGSTWTTIWEHVEGSFSDTAWTSVTYDVSAVADGEAAFQIRFQMGPTDSSVVYCGWNIDDLGFFGSSPSYLEGTVSDNMGPIEGAVVSLDGTAYEAETNASGFYHLVAPAGTYDVTASALGHNPAQAAGVVLLPEQTTVRNFTLTYPEIVVTPTALNVELDYGDIETRNLTIQNTGNGLLEWSISYGTADRGSEAFAVDVYPGENLVHFADLDSPSTWEIVAGLPGTAFFGGDFIANDFTQMYVIDNDTDLLSVMDVATGARTVVGPVSVASGHTWTGLTGTASGEIYASSTNGTTSTLYMIDPATAATTQIGSITNSPAVIDIAMSPDGMIYATDVTIDSLLAVDPATGAGTVVGPLGVGISYAQGLDFDDATGVLYMAGYTSSGALYTVDTATGTATMVGAFPGGAEVDCLAIASAGVTWFTALPEEGTVAPGGSTTVVVTFDSTQVEGPGTYTGSLIINSNDGDENPIVVPLTMSVTGGGNLNGTVTSDGTTPIAGATVTIDELGQDRTTNGSGFYEFLNMIPGTYHVTATASGYAPTTAFPVVITANQTTTQNFTLGAAEIDVDPLTIEHTQLPNTQQVLNDAITISNSGTGDLHWTASVQYTSPRDDNRDASVLIVTPDAVAGGDVSQITATLAAFSDLTVTLFDASTGTPSVADMLAYDVVLVGNDYVWTSSSIDKTALSNNLADLIDAGGKVIAASFIWSYDDWGFLGGRFMTQNYSPFTMATTDFFESTTLGDYDDTHPIMQGITNITDGFNHQDVGLSPNGTWVASWADDEYFVAVAPNCVGLNQEYFDNAVYGGQVGELLYNSIMFLTEGAASWMTVAPMGGTIAAGGSAMLDLTFDTTDLVIGDYTAVIHIESNDASEPDVEIDVTLHVTDVVPTPTPTPTSVVPTPTPTFTAVPTATPAIDLGVRLDMPTFIRIGEQFYIDGLLDNPGAPLAQVPTFFILEVYGEFWFWPSWAHYAPPVYNDIDFRYEDVPTGTKVIEVLPEFIWPDTGTTPVTGLRFYGAMLNNELNAIRGEFDVVEWGYGP